MSVLTLKNVSKTFREEQTINHAVSDVSLEIAAGDFIALRGPSGSGKSTLLNIIGFLELPDTGDVFYKSQLIQTNKERDQVRRRDIGFVFQNFNLSPIFSALENVEFPLQLLGDHQNSKDKSMEFLRQVGMEKFAHQKPSQLSGGQRQRVAIARALVKNPSFIIADEPTANLDQKNAHGIIELMARLNRENGATIIIATHDQKVADAAKTILNMEDGKLI